MRRFVPSGPLRWMWAAVVLTGACTSSAPPPSPPPVLEAADPDPARVEAMLVLVGDAGDALPGRSPVLATAADDLERWAPRLPPNTIRIAFLGDLVYPEGLRAPGHPEHARDTLRLHAQLRPALGPAAREAGVHADLVTGNHDWGGRGDADGLARVERLAAHVREWQEAGERASLRPAPGSLGPEVVDVGASHRLLFLDTHAWLYADTPTRDAAVEGVVQALADAGERTVSVVAHHPLVSGGAHGLTPPTGDVVGALRAALTRTGILTQDAWSGRYQRLIEDMRRAFRSTSPTPLVWAAGHDHSLQVIAATEADQPRWTVVSGSASRLGDVASAPGMIFGGAWPGYARLFLLDDGSAVLQMVAGAPGTSHCPDAVGPDLDACMAAGTASFHTVFSRRLR
jgi:hypothetical protein